MVCLLGPSILLKPSVFVHSPSPEVTPITENSPTENETDVMVSTQAAHHDSRGLTHWRYDRFKSNKSQEREAMIVPLSWNAVNFFFFTLSQFVLLMLICRTFTLQRLEFHLPAVYLADNQWSGPSLMLTPYPPVPFNQSPKRYAPNMLINFLETFP